MNLSEVAMAAAITVSIGGISYATFNVDGITRSTKTVANHVTCRTVDEAIVAYVGRNNTAPTKIKQIEPWVKGDISAYRIVKGQAAGPGC